MNQSNFLEIAQPISVDAIATFLNSHLILEGITVVKTKLKEDCLQILLAANSIPPQEKCVEFITNKLLIKDNSLKKVTISGLQIGENFPEWYQEIELNEQVAIVQQTNSSAIAPSVWNSITKKASGFGASIGSTMNQAGKSIIETTSKVSESFTPASVNNTFTQVTNKVGSLVESVSNNPHLQNLTETFTPASVNNTFTQVTNAVGSLTEEVSNNPHLQNLTENFKNWLIENIDQVDIVRAEIYVKQLQQKYPDETASKIAHRLIIEKATYAGGTELASSILPDIAIAMFAVDLAATTLLQVEMIYLIACAYGMDLKEPARKEEILAIFSLSLGGSQILKAGLGFVRNVPVAGGVISASSNALAVYTLGYAACRFYEAKSNPLLIEANLEEIQAAINDADKISQATEL